MILFPATLILYLFELKPYSIEDAFFHSFIFIFAFSECRGLAMFFFFFKHNHSRKFGSCPSGEQMRRRLPAVLLRLSLPFYCTALILDRIGIFLLLLGEGYSDIFFVLLFTDSVIQQKRETEKEWK